MFEACGVELGSQNDEGITGHRHIGDRVYSAPNLSNSAPGGEDEAPEDPDIVHDTEWKAATSHDYVGFLSEAR